MLALFGSLIAGVTVIKSANGKLGSNKATEIAIDNSVPDDEVGIKRRNDIPQLKTSRINKGLAPANALINAGRQAMFFVPTVTASKTDSLVTDVDSDGKADPGDTLKYTIVIGAAGEDATGVTFSDVPDANTTFAGGTLSTSPVAVNDSFPVTVTGNVRIDSASLAVPFSVVSNDYLGSNPTSTISAFDATTANGGQIVMTTSGGDIGKFSYNPPAGFEGTDTFTYTLSDNANITSSSANRTATVSITVSGMIWFINNNVGSSGDGRLLSPFKTLADFQAVNNGTGNHPAANDNIFVYESATDYVGPVTLLNGQKFIGQDATSSLSSITGITPATGSDSLPPINPTGAIVNITSSGNSINLGQNNLLRGFIGGNSATDIEGTNFGTVNISEISLNGTGRTLNLTTGTLNGTFPSLSSTNSSTTGISLSGVAGSLTTGSTTISNSTGIGISVGSSSATFNFANTSVTGSGGTGVSLTGNSGAITFADLDISPDASQKGFLATGNSQTITATSGTIITSTVITSTDAAGVEINRTAGTTPLAIALTSVSTSGGTKGIFLKNTSGSFTINGDGTNTAVGGNGSGGTIAGMWGADSTIDGIGVYLENVQNVTLRRLMVNGTNQNYGIRGFSVSNFTLEYSTVNGPNGNTAGEGSVYFGSTSANGITGTGAITNCNFAGGRDRNFSVTNTANTLNRLTILGTSFGSTQSFAGASGDSLSIQAINVGTVLNATVNSSTFTGAAGNLVSFAASAGASMDALFGTAGQGNTLSNNHAQNSIGLGGLTVSSAGTLTFNISSNTMRDANGDAVEFEMLAPAGAEGRSINGTFNNNIIGAAGAASSGSATGSGVKLAFADNTTAPRSQATIALTNNTIRNYAIRAINADNVSGAYDVNATISNNTAAEPAATAFSGLFVGAGLNASDDIDVCAGISGNNFSAGGVLQSDIETIAGNGASTIRLPGVTTPATEAGVESFILANNNFAGTTVDAAVTSPATFAANYLGGAACTAPTESLTLSHGVDQKLLAESGSSLKQDDAVKLSQAELDFMVQSAISRWEEAGASAETIAMMRSMTFEVADLQDGELATFESNRVKVNSIGAGNGWFVDASPADDAEFELPVPDREFQALDTSAAFGRTDLFTVVTRGLGVATDSESHKARTNEIRLMEGALGTGVRRAPLLKAPEPVELQAADRGSYVNMTVTDVSTSETFESKTNKGSLDQRRYRPETVGPNFSVGTLPAGKTVTAIFNVTVNNPFAGPEAQVCNQGSITGSNFPSVLTDDPAVGGAADPTCTNIDLQSDLEITSKTDTPDPVIAGNNITYMVNFRNNGPDGTGATVTDATPTGTTFVSASVTTGTGWTPTNPTVGSTGNVVFSKSQVALNETAVFEIVVKVDGNVAGGTIISNTATAATSGSVDPVPSNNSKTTTTTVVDLPDVSVAVSPSSVSEDGSNNLVYTFSRTTSIGGLTANYSVGGTATFSTDYTQTGAATFVPPNGTVTFAEGSLTATVTIDPVSNSTVEPDETVVLTVTAGTGYDVGAPTTATGTIVNDDTDVSVAVAPSSTSEDGATSLVYTFARTGVTTGALTANFTIGGTATFNTDYTQTGATAFTPPNGTVEFAPGSSTATVTVDPTADTGVEAHETVVLTVAAGTGYNVGIPNTATGTIINDDTNVSVAVSPLSVSEDGATNLVYTFAREGVTSTPLTVNFSIGGTATYSTDYTQVGAATFAPPTGTVTFGAGNSTATITVDPNADITAEPDETVILTVTAGTGYNVGAPSSSTGTISNDDVTVSVAVSPGAVDEDGATNLVYTFTRNDPNGALNVNFSVGGTATSFTDYTQTGAATFVPPNGTVTFANGSLTATVTIDPAANSAVEPDETVILTVVAGFGYSVGAPSSVTGTIVNDDTDVSVAVAPSSASEDGASNLVYTFTRTGVTTGALTANFSVGGTATFNTDYTQTGATTFVPPTGTVDFAPGSSTATVTIDPTADSPVEPDETVVLTVTAGTGYNVGVPSSATGTITNDDTDVSVAVSPSSVAEDGATNLVYTFSRAGVTSSPLTVNFTIGGTATFNTDYTQVGAATFVPPNGTVIFGAGNSTATVTVNPTADMISEADETVILTVAAGTGYNVGIPSSATGTIVNDDAADVEITAKTDAPDPVCVGANITYTIGFRNNSAGPTINGKVSDTIPANTTFVSATLPAGWNRADSVAAGGTGTLMFTKSSIAGGETASFTVVVQVNAGTLGGTIISNTATASSDFPDDVPGNNSKTATTTVDPNPPVISGLSADQSSLWPKNHKMRDVAINYSATDGCGGVTCSITNITSNEPINGTGDGDTSPDWEFVDNHNVRLRTESAGGSTGRIYTITVTCTDSAGNSTTKTTEVHVGHNILSPGSGSAFKINTAVTFTGTFWDTPGKKHTAVWQFDDLTTGATIVEPAGSKNGTAKGTYTFKDPGVYKVTLKVTDSSRVTSWVDTQDDVEAIVVIYDPASGYTIGGGWIDSPLGALLSEPNAVGKMTFGYTSKIFKGATNPKGESQLDFLLGNFEFNALNYDYLVIERGRAQFRGFGKVNGVSGYDFIATVIDGSLAGGGPDKFRIKIWNKTTGVVVYDNQMGASDAADPITPVGFGSDIVIKK